MYLMKINNKTIADKENFILRL